MLLKTTEFVLNVMNYMMMNFVGYTKNDDWHRRVRAFLKTMA